MSAPPQQPSRNELAERTGPFYDTSALASWLGVTRDALDRRSQNGALLSVTTSDGMRLYPAWQFTAEGGSLVPGLHDVLTVLRGGSGDGWTIALWLVTPVVDLNGRSAIEWLKAGGAASRVLELARYDAAAWSA
jgi:hypothetical protein